MMCTTFWHPDGTPMSARNSWKFFLASCQSFLRMKLNFALSGAILAREKGCCWDWPRVIRIRGASTRLAEIMSIESVDDFGPDQTTRAVVASNARPIEPAANLH
jgi:hypothetical protein